MLDDDAYPEPDDEIAALKARIAELEEQLDTQQGLHDLRERLSAVEKDRDELLELLRPGAEHDLIIIKRAEKAEAERDAAIKGRDGAVLSKNEMEKAYHAAIKKRDEARRFGEDAAAKYNTLLKEASEVTCAFCGEKYPRGTPRHGDGALAAHIKTCPKHPMRDQDAKLSLAREALEKIARFDHLPVTQAVVMRKLARDALALVEGEVEDA